jgi:hypothetical protein
MPHQISISTVLPLFFEETPVNYCTSVNLRLKPKFVFEVGNVLATNGLFIV